MLLQTNRWNIPYGILFSLQTDCHLVLEPDASCTANASDCFDRAWKKMCDPLLSKLRFYLNNISSLDYDLTTEMRKVRISFHVFRYEREFLIFMKILDDRIRLRENATR